jgi:hypothetical protein
LCGVDGVVQGFHRTFGRITAYRMALHVRDAIVWCFH